VEREVFVLANGESFSVSDVCFEPLETREEISPCWIQEHGQSRKGMMRCTIESANVSFNAVSGSLKVSDRGQLSTKDDQFFEVTISSIEPANQHERVFGQASRKFNLRTDH
jgi:hypothetical protein